MKQKDKEKKHLKDVNKNEEKKAKSFLSRLIIFSFYLY